MDDALRKAKLKVAALERAKLALKHNFERIDHRVDVINPRLREIEAAYDAGDETVFEIEA